MSAHTVTTNLVTSKGAGGGLKQTFVTGTLTASYDTGGSLIVLDSTVTDGFSDEVRCVDVTIQGTTEYQTTFIPGASNGPALGKVAVFDGAGVEVTATTSLATVAYNAIVTGTDG
jgi:hypothetical protein